jgi:hypothetical protein
MRKWPAMALRYWYLFCLILGLSLSAHAQGVSVSGQAIVNTQVSMPGIPGNVVLQAVPNATITVCAATGGGIPCSPLVTIYANATLSIVAPNPVTADLNGNFQFWVPPIAAGYIYSQTALGIVGQLFIISPATLSGGGGGGSPALPGNSLQFNNAGSFGGATGITTPDGSNLYLKGPDPHADIRAFGARNVSTFTASASCNGTTAITLTNPSQFINGDGITIPGCGATNTMATPTAPTVTPSVAAGETDTGSDVSSATAATTYNYKVVWRDKFGALTAPSPVTTIANGQATLGLQTQAISSITRTNDTLTVVTSAPNLLVVGATVDIIAPNGVAEFGGWYRVSTITNNTTFTMVNTPIDTRAQGWITGDVTTTSGGSGSVNYYLDNHLVLAAEVGGWEAYICSDRASPGTYALIGISKPQGLFNGYVDLNFDDFGSPYMDNQVYPSYVTNASCNGSATNDPLSTTIVSGGGTVNLVVADTAIQTASGKTATLDAAPNILAAMKSVSSFGSVNRGTVYIPPTLGSSSFAINSYLAVPVAVSIVQAGSITLNETLSLPGGQNWFCTASTGAPQQFSFATGATIAVAAASPGLYLSGSGTMQFCNIESPNANGALLAVADNANPFNFDYDNFISGGATTDRLSMGLIIRDTAGTIQNYHFNKVLFTGGPDQINDKSWSPLLWVAPSEQAGAPDGLGPYYLTFDKVQFTRRGIATFGMTADFSYYYRQGGITPVVMSQPIGGFTSPGANLFFNFITLDTEGQPVVSILASSGPVQQTSVTIKHGQLGVGGPSVTGTRPGSFISDNFPYTNGAPIPNRDAEVNGEAFTSIIAPYAATGTTAIQAVKTFAMPVHIPSGHSFYFDMLQPTSVAGAVAAGGLVPVGTWFYAVSATGADGGETIVSTPSSGQVTTLGNQTVNLTWVNPVGSYSSNVDRCIGSCVAADGQTPIGAWFRVASHVAGTTFSDTTAAPPSTTLPQVTGTGVTILNGAEISVPFMQILKQTVASLPAATAANAGQFRTVSDSTAIAAEGQTCTGGGAVTASAFSNGTVWKCF